MAAPNAQSKKTAAVTTLQELRQEMLALDTLDGVKTLDDLFHHLERRLLDIGLQIGLEHLDFSGVGTAPSGGTAYAVHTFQAKLCEHGKAAIVFDRIVIPMSIRQDPVLARPLAYRTALTSLLGVYFLVEKYAGLRTPPAPQPTASAPPSPTPPPAASADTPDPIQTLLDEHPDLRPKLLPDEETEQTEEDTLEATGYIMQGRTVDGIPILVDPVTLDEDVTELAFAIGTQLLHYLPTAPSIEHMATLWKQNQSAVAFLRDFSPELYQQVKEASAARDKALAPAAQEAPDKPGGKRAARRRRGRAA